jgi:hypothetical protein
MGFLRFRRTLRPFPGLRLNLSKSGVSTSVGQRGLWFTISRRGTRETIGIPGTGISYTETQNAGHQEAPQRPHSIWYAIGVLVLVVILYVLTR